MKRLILSIKNCLHFCTIQVSDFIGVHVLHSDWSSLSWQIVTRSFWSLPLQPGTHEQSPFWHVLQVILKRLVSSKKKTPLVQWSATRAHKTPTPCPTERSRRIRSNAIWHRQTVEETKSGIIHWWGCFVWRIKVKVLQPKCCHFIKIFEFETEHAAPSKGFRFFLR